MKAKIVTGYIPIIGHPRGPEEYGALGEKLGGVPVPKKCFYMKVEDTWMAKCLRAMASRKLTKPIFPTAAPYDNPEKNTVAYHCVNHQKSSFLVQAADEDPEADVLVWVDYGIFRLPGVNNQAIYEFMEKIDDKAIYAPGCWGGPVIQVDHNQPCWRFCGSVLAVPRKLVDWFDYECRTQARRHMEKTNNVEWEVNTWARIESAKPSNFHWYQADHNVSLFTGLELRQ